MERCLKKLVVLLVVALCVCVAQAQDNTMWYNTSGDGEWFTDGNWDLGHPVAGDTASFGPSGDLCTVNGDAYAEAMNMGLTPGVTSSLAISAGSSLNINGSSTVSFAAGSAANVLVQGEFINGWQLTVGQWGDGVITVDGGLAQAEHVAFNAAGGGTNSSGFINVINGGTLRVNTQFIVIAWNAVGPVMNVDDSSQILANSATFSEAAAEAWANAGFLTGNGLPGASNLIIETVLIEGAPFTSVTAVPEPTTMLLLSSGMLLLRKRK